MFLLIIVFNLKTGGYGEDNLIHDLSVLLRESLSLVTCIYKKIANDLAILRFLVAQCIERPHVVG